MSNATFDSFSLARLAATTVKKGRGGHESGDFVCICMIIQSEDGYFRTQFLQFLQSLGRENEFNMRRLDGLPLHRKE